MKKLTVICFLLMALTKMVCAQEQLSIKQQADKCYDRYEYYKSLMLYQQIVNGNKTPLQVTERIADCYRNLNNYADAETWYAKAIINPKVAKEDHLYYAEILQRNEKFEQAKQQYRLYFNTGDAELALKLAGCDSAELWMRKRSGYSVQVMPNVNTTYSDWGLNYDGKTGFFFTSDRVTDDNIDNRTGNNWFKLYRYNLSDNMISPVALSSADDSYKGDYHLGPIALNKTGDTAYITLTVEVPKRKLGTDKKNWKSNQRLFSRRLELVIATRENDSWTITENFAYNNIREYSVSSPALSPDGKLLYFSSDMPGGEGKTDIWYCEKQADGNWGKPVNCGKNINTKEEDDFPYLDDKGNLYYASKGLPGMGGYDIYVANGEKNNWSVPRNLKYPANSTSDDFYFITHDGLIGYLSSNREGGTGSDDIYSFSFNPADTVTLKHEAPGPITKNIPLAGKKWPPDTSIGIVLTTIYYDLDKSYIRPDAAIELDRLAYILKQYPTLNIQISSYTDSRASGDYNEALSERRAKAVVRYLSSKGIDPRRLTAKWFGKTNLVNDCGNGVPCTEAEHQMNRRSEFKIISK